MTTTFIKGGVLSATQLNKLSSTAPLYTITKNFEADYSVSATSKDSILKITSDWNSYSAFQTAQRAVVTLTDEQGDLITKIEFIRPQENSSIWKPKKRKYYSNNFKYYYQMPQGAPEIWIENGNTSWSQTDQTINVHIEYFVYNFSEEFEFAINYLYDEKINNES